MTFKSFWLLIYFVCVGVFVLLLLLTIPFRDERDHHLAPHIDPIHIIIIDIILFNLVVDIVTWPFPISSPIVMMFRNVIVIVPFPLFHCPRPHYHWCVVWWWSCRWWWAHPSALPTSCPSPRPSPFPAPSPSLSPPRRWPHWPHPSPLPWPHIPTLFPIPYLVSGVSDLLLFVVTPSRWWCLQSFLVVIIVHPPLGDNSVILVIITIDEYLLSHYKCCSFPFDSGDPIPSNPHCIIYCVLVMTGLTWSVAVMHSVLLSLLFAILPIIVIYSYLLLC